MKYQQLENLESGWKWKYLVKKHQEGERITKHLDDSVASQYIDELLIVEHNPKQIANWIDQHLNPEIDNRIKQTIRAKRKRYFNAEKAQSRKKSIDLNFEVWQALSTQAKQKKMTLSQMITMLIEETESKAKYVATLLLVKEELQTMLSRDIDNH